MEPYKLNYWLAISFALIGWALRVVWYYFKFDSDTESLNVKKFWMVYDKYIITGFAGAIVLAILSDVLWVQFLDSLVNLEGTPYDERYNIALGFLVVLILMFFDNKAQNINEKK